MRGRRGRGGPTATLVPTVAVVAALATLLAALPSACRRDTRSSGGDSATADSAAGAGGQDAAEEGLLPGTDAPRELTAGDVRCFVFDRYVVTVRDTSDESGQHIEIAPRPPAPAAPACGATSPASRPVPGDAVFFAGLFGDYLFTDQGTGPDARALLVFHLPELRPVASVSYVGRATVERDAGGTLVYWEPISARLPQVCPDSARITAQHLDVAYEEQVRLALVSGTPERTGEIRCTARQ